MLQYLQKYNNLPQELRDNMSAPDSMSAIEALEKKYGLNLAAIVMKIMVRDVDINNLSVSIADEFNINKNKADLLADDLKENVLFRAADYLGITVKPKEAKAMPLDISVKEESSVESAEKSSVQAVDYLFSPEDEEEIKNLAQKINGDIKNVKLSDEKIELEINSAVAEAQINFGSDLLAARFRHILKTYFRGIRDRINAKQALIKAIESGGLGFDNDSAEKVLKIVDFKIEKLNKLQPDIVQPEKIKTADIEQEKLIGFKDSGVRDVDYDLSALKKPASKGMDNLHKPPEAEKTVIKLDTVHELAPPPPAIIQAKPRNEEPSLAKAINGKPEVLQELKKKLSFSNIKNAFFKKPHDKIIIKEAGTSTTNRQGIKPEPKLGREKAKVKQAAEEQVRKIKQIDARQIDKTRGKIKMDDVKFTPRSMGPIEELRYIDLVNLRRLCKTPEEIITKIKEKINLLEEDNYAQRLEGIKAWRQSPVNKVYLEMGHESIAQKRPINAIIEDRKVAGRDYLNDREFEAITDLNKTLRF